VDIAKLRRFGSGALPVALLSILLLSSLFLMSAATQNSEQFGRLYMVLLVVNLLGLISLLVLITSNLLRLRRQYRNRATGSRLTVRLMLMFVLLSLAPVSLVYYFSLGFIQRGIDSWFDVRVERTLDDALALSRASLETRSRELMKRTEQMSSKLQLSDEAGLPQLLDELRMSDSASELTLFMGGGHVVASSSINPADIVPDLPDESVIRQVRQSGSAYVTLDPMSDSGLYVRVVTQVPAATPLLDTRFLQALYPISDRVSVLANSVESAYTQYQQLLLLRDPLKNSFILMLSLVLLLGVLMAVWLAFFSARRLVTPIRVLAIGTRAVAAGDYTKRLPMHSGDELGFLVESFNDMTLKIAHAQEDVRNSQLQAEQERAYLWAVLARLSSGVLTLDVNRTVYTVNVAAGHILGVESKACIGYELNEIVERYEYLKNFANAITPHLAELSSDKKGKGDWREEVILYGATGRQVLMCGGAALPGEGGYVIVFDDVTNLVQAQRDAAWGEVARRLAHEIKNPLTPIQLSAERLRHKYLKTMNAEDAEVLDKSTHTIVQQVEVMKEMVQAFSEYARTPKLELRPLALNYLIDEVLDLYRNNRFGVTIVTDLQDDLPLVSVDSGRMRQLLHNLIKNALEAMVDGEMKIKLVTRVFSERGVSMVELLVLDSGPGIPAGILENIFEPYVTAKPKGSGLGLAIVKKIVEEHSGVIWAENIEHGACMTIRLPVAQSSLDDVADVSEAENEMGDAGQDDVTPFKQHDSEKV
jgi:nitrogen fixation/metabolism regulation signal transduction histidine kinase